MSHMNPSTDRTCRPEKPVKGGLITIVKCLRKTLPKVVRGQVSSASNISTSDSSITTGVSITNESSGLPTSISPPVLHAGSSRGDVSNRQLITGCTKVGLKVTAAAAEAVPGVGTIIKGTIGAVLEILEAIERSTDNKAEIVLSMHKLRSLLRRIERTPTAGRDENWNYLHEELLATRETLAKLHDRPRISLATDTIVQALQQCHESIQDALTEYTALSQMEGGQILRDIHGKVGKIELSIQNGFGNQERLLQMIKSTITIMDAIGHEFLCDAVMATDPKFIHKFLKLTFEGKNSATDKMLLEFLDKKQYNLCIDQGIQVVLFESKEEGELLVEPGTKVVMNVILTQEKQEVGYECPVCGTWNSSTDHTANSAKDCSNRGCPGRFQIIDDRNDNSNDVGNWGKWGRNISLLRNIHLEQHDTFGFPDWSWLSDIDWDDPWRPILVTTNMVNRRSRMGSSTVTGLRKSGSEASGSHALSDQPRRKIDSASIGFVWGYDNEDMDTSDSVWGTESTENTYLQSMGSYSSGRSLDCGYGMFHGDTDDGKAGNSTELQSRTTTSKTLPVNTKGGAHGAATLEKSIPVKDSRKVEPRAERDRNRRSRRRKTRNAAGKYNVGALQGNHEAV